MSGLVYARRCSEKNSSLRSLRSLRFIEGRGPGRGDVEVALRGGDGQSPVVCIPTADHGNEGDALRGLLQGIDLSNETELCAGGAAEEY